MENKKFITPDFECSPLIRELFLMAKANEYFYIVQEEENTITNPITYNILSLNANLVLTQDGKLKKV